MALKFNVQLRARKTEMGEKWRHYVEFKIIDWLISRWPSMNRTVQLLGPKNFH